MLLRVARDSKGRAIGSEATGKYGTPKCEFIMMLLRVDEPENRHLGGCWVGAHPSIGEVLSIRHVLYYSYVTSCVCATIYRRVLYRIYREKNNTPTDVRVAAVCVCV